MSIGECLKLGTPRFALTQTTTKTSNTMTTDQDIFKSMRDDLIDRIEHKYFTLERCSAWASREIDTGKIQEMWNTIRDGATIPQLWSLFKLIVEREVELDFVSFSPRDHLGITFAGIYVGIEIDGYTHS